jgi:Transcriptional regulator containing an amidase domain and an AraC-type DNA-binding HTH domain
MIYSSEADIVSFARSVTQSLRPYAKANEVKITFSSAIKEQILSYQPFLLSQTLIRLICNVINLVPPKSKIVVRLLFCPEHTNLFVEIENTGINLLRVHEINIQSCYYFEVFSKPNGTVYRLVLPLLSEFSTAGQPIRTAAPNEIPQFYSEIQKRLQSHFTKVEKHIAELGQNQPKEAAFMQRINAQIKARLEDENFSTDSLCKAMSMSRTQLFRRMKSLIRQAPAHYIRDLRLKRAKELLETDDLTVSEVAFRTGFQNLSHFTNIFHKQYGILPSAFLRSRNCATNE